jgi:hypothetical protein
MYKVIFIQFFFLFHGSTALGLLIVEISRSHSDTPHSVGLLWMSDRPDTETTHKRRTSMPSAGFEPVIPASERAQTHMLDRAATGIGFVQLRGKIPRALRRRIIEGGAKGT